MNELDDRLLLLWRELKKDYRHRAFETITKALLHGDMLNKEIRKILYSRAKNLDEKDTFFIYSIFHQLRTTILAIDEFRGNFKSNTIGFPLIAETAYLLILKAHKIADSLDISVLQGFQYAINQLRQETRLDE